ncbi:MAG: bifunctional DNA-formamidopyrimidine glycosylase/DNA-(apurinic or apyrimidinic site) lyase [Alphaproteobacteria bacterium]|nr:bifunctional DNA-formamidopyrimidine glycosylase/DNA-(apurinic or apyrimidinic site) lyase [Alphaproteobacteria bacterium]
MPELPEVETVVAGLKKKMEGRKIRAVTTTRKDLRVPFPRGLFALKNVNIQTLSRRAKYILLYLENGKVLVIHLGMSGRMTLGHDEELQKHDHMVITLDNGFRAVLNDPRRFGLVALVDADALSSHRLFCHLGPEPLDKDFNAAYLSRKLANRKTPIKLAIMDQRIVVGVGNIYASEALYKAGIAPGRLAGDVKPGEIKKLVAAIKKTLKAAIAAGGSSLKDYVQADGTLGYFQHNWAVYGRAGEKCRARGCKGRIVKTVMGGRATFACPRCQK